MRLFRVALLRLRALLFGRRLDDDAREELRAHFDRQVAMHVDAGMTPAAARRAAALEVGGLRQLEEACRDARGLGGWDALVADLRDAIRYARRRPGVTLAGGTVVALGVAAATAVFAVVDAALLRPLPYPSADRLYALYEVSRVDQVGRTRVAPLNFLDWREASEAFADMAAYTGTGFALTGHSEPEFVIGRLVTPSLLDVLGVRPAIGRSFRPDEAEAGQHRVILLTDRLWRRSFGADPDVVGRHVSVDGQPFEIIGVLPASFTFFDERYELLAPLATRGVVADGPPITRNARYLQVVGRLADGVQESAARDELAAIARRLGEDYPEANGTVGLGMTSLADDLVGDTRRSLLLAFGAVTLVLLVAGVNVAGLALARGTTRGRELEVRAALGASRGRLVRQLATEGAVLFAAGGLAGLALAAGVLSAVGPRLSGLVPRAAEIGVDWRLVAFAAIATAVVGAMCSVMPALNLAGGRLPSSSRGAASAAPRGQRLRAALIVAQMAAALTLLAGAGLAVRSLDSVGRVDPGFDPRGTLTFNVVMSEAPYPAASDMRRFSADLAAALEVAPGVVAAGLTTALPFSDQNIENGYTVDGASPDPSERPVAGLRGVSGRYADAIAAPVLRGRALGPEDTADAPLVAVVTEDFAARYVAAADPIGVRLKMGGAASDDPWRTIVGVVPAIRHQALDQSARPEVWLPFAQMPDDFVTSWARGIYAAARTDGDPVALVPGVRSVVRALDPAMPLSDVATLEALVGRSTAARRLETTLLAGFAMVVLVLASVGLFAMLAFHVAQRLGEFGVRLALGATPRGVQSLVLGRGLRLLGAGLVLGLPGALLIGPAVAHLLYGVTPHDPISLTAAAGVLGLVTLAASALPARRATRADPLAALRQD